jgi:hypothetical protein
MALKRAFAGSGTLAEILVILNSVGAHIGAKLDRFGTDERTLTDELCDMFFVWAQLGLGAVDPVLLPQPELNIIARLPEEELRLEIVKTSQREEASIGADLALKLTTPDGVKRALLQAKVLDPDDGKFRCDSPDGWDKLWAQLVLMRQRSTLAFLLVYIPGRNLSGAMQGVPTWEQDLLTADPGKASSKLGATLVPVEALLDASNHWKKCPPISHRSLGALNPAGISIGRLLLEMVLCRRGTWLPPASFPSDGSGPFLGETGDRFPVHYRPYREVSVSMSTPRDNDWEEFRRTLQERINFEGFT